jgi:prevent-host-death family protein
MKNMAEVGIRALKQNASTVVADVVAGETVTITDRGRPVAQITPIATSPLQRMLANGTARPARRELAALPVPAEGPPLTPILVEMRDAERY